MKKFLLFLSIAFCLHVNAQISTLMLFNGPNGLYPQGGDLLYDGTYLYGMTSAGGTYNYGVIFKIKTDGTGYTKLLNFNDTNGRSPYGSLIYDGTFLYGMTSLGGTNHAGVIFKIMPDGSAYDTLLNFNATTGGGPGGSLYYDGVYLYGMNRGLSYQGAIFKIKTDGTGFAKLLDFTGPNGKAPAGSFISDGNFLYATTTAGGTNNDGVVFKIKPDGTGFTKLVDFAGTTNGSQPYGNLYYDGTYLYGTTRAGGTSTNCPLGCGTVFKVKPDGTGFAKLLDFDRNNGYYPNAGAFISDGTFLYGTTQSGGVNGDGNIYRIKPDGTGYQDLIDFMNNANGKLLEGSVISDGNSLYGMTYDGCNAATSYNNGTVYKFCIPAAISTATICVGGTATLTATGATNYNYTWSTTETTNSITVTPSVTAVYTVTGTVGTCTSVATTTVTVINAAPTLSLTVNSYSICNGSSQTFTASGASNYTWAPAATLSNPNTANPIANPTTTTVYTVTGSNACGAANPLTVTVTVNPTPTLSISVPGLTCVSSCAVFTSTILPSSAVASTYVWDFGDGSTSAAANPCHYYSLSGTFNVLLTVTTVYGCVGTATTSVVINPTPSMTVTSPPPYCPGDIITSPNIVTLPLGGVTYSYTTSNITIGLPAAGAGTPMPITAPANTTLVDIVSVLTYTPSLNGCLGAVTNETITIRPTPYVQPIANQYVCSGAYSNPVQIVTMPPMATINWAVLYQAAIPTTGSSNPIPGFQLSNPGSLNIPVTVTITPTLNGCVGPDSTFNIIVYSQPTASFTLTQDTAPHTWDVYPSFTGGTTPYSYLWDWGDGSNSSVAYPSHVYAQAGSYNICLIITDVNGCSTSYCEIDAVSRIGNNSTQSNMVYVNVINGTAPSGIQKLASNNDVNIYPNPAQNNFTIETTANGKQTLQVFDVNGKIVLTQTIIGKTIIDTGNLNSGVYNLTLINNTSVATKKLVIVK